LRLIRLLRWSVIHVEGVEIPAWKERAVEGVVKEFCIVDAYVLVGFAICSWFQSHDDGS
jgi:hypothetical protein